MDQAKKAVVLAQQVASLEEQLSELKSKIVCLDDSLLYMTELIEGTSEQVLCELLRSLLVVLLIFACVVLTAFMFRYLLGCCC
jgi:hypothetical protein